MKSAIRVAVGLAFLFAGCAHPANDTEKIGTAAAADVSNEVHCNCVVNDASKKGVCSDASVCPGPNCPCAGVDYDMCLPPDLNHDTATDPNVIAKLKDPSFDFSAAVDSYCADRASVIMIDIGAVSEHFIICDSQKTTVLLTTIQLDIPALVNCHAVAYDPKPSNGTAPIMTTTSEGKTCAEPCGTQVCINGPPSVRPDCNCDGANVFELNGTINPSACTCNQILAGDSCNNTPSENFCAPPAGE